MKAFEILTGAVTMSFGFAVVLRHYREKIWPE